jgi:hypothetical protein
MARRSAGLSSRAQGSRLGLKAAKVYCESAINMASLTAGVKSGSTLTTVDWLLLNGWQG